MTEQYVNCAIILIDMYNTLNKTIADPEPLSSDVACDMARRAYKIASDDRTVNELISELNLADQFVITDKKMLVNIGNIMKLAREKNLERMTEVMSVMFAAVNRAIRAGMYVTMNYEDKRTEASHPLPDDCSFGDVIKCYLKSSNAADK